MSGIIASVCKKCGRVTYPRHARCPSCGAGQFTEASLDGTAVLLTFTRVYNLSLAFEERFITLGIVEFEGGCRALGRLFVDEPEIGMKLRPEIATVRVQDYEQIEGLCFRAAD